MSGSCTHSIIPWRMRTLSGGQVIIRLYKKGDTGMVRAVAIGIDGLDADLLRVYGPSLPNLRLLMLESPYLELQSCFPPDLAPSWASIYTGQNPAQHGVLSMQSDGEEHREHGNIQAPSLACSYPRGIPSGRELAMPVSGFVSRIFISLLFSQHPFQGQNATWSGT